MPNPAHSAPDLFGYRKYWAARLTPAPFFVEYRFYAENHNGRLVTVATRPDFTIASAQARAK